MKPLSILTLLSTLALLCACPAKSEKRIERRNHNIELLKKLSSNQGNNQFWEYYGFRDWWRIPLIYPFQITMIDHFGDGDICVSRKESVADAKFETIVGKVHKFSLIQNFIFGKTETKFFTLEVNSQEVSYFQTETEMFNNMNVKPIKLKTVQEWADDFAL